MANAKVGDFILVKTVIEDYGECLYEITNETVTDKQNIVKHKCIMVASSGKANREGYFVWDSLDIINECVNKKITEIIAPENVEKTKARLVRSSSKGNDDSATLVEKLERKHGGSGCFEL